MHVRKKPIRTRTIVVGVDGSSGSMVALRWAIGHARALGAVVIALNVNDYYPRAGASSRASAMMGATGRHIGFSGSQALANEAAWHTVRGMIEELGEAANGVPLEPAVIDDPLVQRGLLRQAIAGADLLVLGSRPQRGLGRFRNGWLARRVLRHAPCPVTIVPHDAVPNHGAPPSIHHQSQHPSN